MSSNDCGIVGKMLDELDGLLSGEMNEVDRARVSANMKTVEKIERWTGGKVTITFAPGCGVGDDEDSINHQYYCQLSAKEDELWLDDRLPQSLPDQTVCELRRLAAYCEQLAAIIEQHADGSQKKGGRR